MTSPSETGGLTALVPKPPDGTELFLTSCEGNGLKAPAMGSTPYTDRYQRVCTQVLEFHKTLLFLFGN